MKNNIYDTCDQVNSCTSCQMCFAVCPVDAISIQGNAEGFYEPIINEDICIHCGKCKKNCYKYDKEIKISHDNKHVYAVKSKDKELLQNSTSGGIATHLAEELIDEGYKVIGVTYNYGLNRAENIIIDDKNDINKIQGSKYIQSYSADVYKTFLSTLRKDKYAVFGLPCQIYAIDGYLKSIKRRDEFILIDLFCHGCPSLTLWEKYTSDIKRKYNLSKFSKIEFRSKKKGWHEFIISILDDKGNLFVSKNEQDGFFRFFFSDKILNDSCYTCKLRSTLTYTDIRLGDYWGKKYDLDLEGVSVVTLVTDKSISIFEKIKEKIIFKEESLEDAIKAQSYGKDYIFNKDEKTKVLELLNKYDNFDTILKEYDKTLPLKIRIRVFLKKVYYLLPKSVRASLRKKYHK